MSEDQKQQIREKSLAKGKELGLHLGYANKLEDFIDFTIDLAIKKTEKAFGGCKNCYGKGYSTTKQYATSHEDFGGEKTATWELDPIRPCDCDRGKQISELKELIQKQTEERIVEKIEDGFSSFTLKDWSGETEVYDEMDRLKESIINLIKNNEIQSN